MKLLDNVIEKVQVQPHKGRLDLILGKNPGLQKMREYFQVLSGFIFTLLSPQRLNLNFESLKMHLMFLSKTEFVNSNL